MSDLKAPPRPELLVRARQEIADNEELRALFSEPPDADWLADNLSVRLSARWGGKDFGEAWDVALYLAQEFFANRDAPIIVADRKTGAAVARLPAEAIWRPGVAVRESGNIVQAQPRLRPDIEAALVQAHHDQAREHHELVRRAEQGPRTRDLRILTSTGRNDLLQRAFEAACEAFTGTLQGRLHDAVTLGRGAQPVTLVASPSMRMPDLSAVNLAFSFEQWLTRSLVQGWVQAVVAAMVERARPDPSVWDWLGRSAEPVLWIGNHDQIQHVFNATLNPWTFVWGDRLVGVRGVGLAVEIDPAMQGASISAEMQHEVWSVEALLPVRITRLDGEITSFDVTVAREHRAEVVR